MNKLQLKKRFKMLYPGKRLLAVQLDGFSHALIYDNGKKEDKITKEVFSHCMPELVCSNQAKAFFQDIGNSQYQNNTQEFCYILPNKR